MKHYIGSEGQGTFPMKRWLFTLMLLPALFVQSNVQPAAAASGWTITITNDTSKDATDLHLEFVEEINNHGLTVTLPAGTSGEHHSTGNHYQIGTEWTGPVKPGQSVTIYFETSGSSATLKKGYWTNTSHQDIGATNTVTGPSAASLQHNSHHKPCSPQSLRNQ